MRFTVTSRDSKQTLTNTFTDTFTVSFSSKCRLQTGKTFTLSGWTGATLELIKDNPTSTPITLTMSAAFAGLSASSACTASIKVENSARSAISSTNYSITMPLSLTASTYTVTMSWVSDALVDNLWFTLQLKMTGTNEVVYTSEASLSLRARNLCTENPYWVDTLTLSNMAYNLGDAD